MKKEKEKNKKGKIKTRRLIVTMLILFLIIFPAIGSSIVYKLYFNKRFTTKDELKEYLANYPDLTLSQEYFYSNHGQKLAGYLYSYDDSDKRGVVVLGHGYACGGHNLYLPVIDYFAKNGFYVFAYDATGTDSSEGKGIYGLPQQIVDMSKAIDYVEELEPTKDLPIVLWGHSWGGYTVTNQLAYHPEVKAVVSVSGFNKSTDLIKSWGLDIVGPLTYYLLPAIKVTELIQCGLYSNSTATFAFSKSDAKIMSVTSDNDKVVPTKYGYDMWYDLYKDDERFSFIKLTGINQDYSHGKVYCSKEYIDDLMNATEESSINHYDYKDNGLNTELFEEIIEFYDSAI